MTKETRDELGAFAGVRGLYGRYPSDFRGRLDDDFRWRMLHCELLAKEIG